MRHRYLASLGALAVRTALADRWISIAGQTPQRQPKATGASCRKPVPHPRHPGANPICKAHGS